MKQQTLQLDIVTGCQKKQASINSATLDNDSTKI